MNFFSAEHVSYPIRKQLVSPITTMPLLCQGTHLARQGITAAHGVYNLKLDA